MEWDQGRFEAKGEMAIIEWRYCLVGREKREGEA